MDSAFFWMLWKIVLELVRVSMQSIRAVPCTWYKTNTQPFYYQTLV